MSDNSRPSVHRQAPISIFKTQRTAAAPFHQSHDMASVLPCRLLALPLELREHIYRLVLSPDIIEILIPGRLYSHDPLNGPGRAKPYVRASASTTLASSPGECLSGNPRPALLRTCSQIYDEGKAFLYSPRELSLRQPQGPVGVPYGRLEIRNVPLMRAPDRLTVSASTSMNLEDTWFLETAIIYSQRLLAYLSPEISVRSLTVSVVTLHSSPRQPMTWESLGLFRQWAALAKRADEVVFVEKHAVSVQASVASAKWVLRSRSDGWCDETDGIEPAFEGMLDQSSPKARADNHVYMASMFREECLPLLEKSYELGA